MDKIIIEGGRPIGGSVKISGAKNAALPIFAATILGDGVSRLSNVPDLRDTRTIAKLIEELGAKVASAHTGEYTIDSATITNYEAPYELVKTMRASCLALGPLLARLGRAKVSYPGGCAIGERPIDQHLKGLSALGADIELAHGYVDVKAPPKGLTGAHITMDMITVTGVMNIMMAATLAKGRTVIDNAAREPEVTALGEYLNVMGANIEGAGTATITITGVTSLRSADVVIIPDRIEAATFMAAAAITGGSVTVTNIDPAMVGAVIDKLIDCGCMVDTKGGRIAVQATGKLRSVNISTAPYPGFPTDMQAQMMALMTVASGTSVIKETIFENRFMHVAELRRMGADISLGGNSATVLGVSYLSGAEVMATDLRASACLVLAGLAAEGETVISRVYHLDRGYERLEEKFSKLGANIRRVSG